MGTKGNNGAIAVFGNIDDYTKAEFKNKHLSLNPLQYKLLQKLDHWLLKQQPGRGSPNRGRPLPSPYLAGPAHIGSAGTQEVQKRKVKELVVLELEIKKLEVQDLEV